jgi:putative component of toxin-antitoxin plasmid stabilization module
MIIFSNERVQSQKILMIHGGHKDSQAIDIKRAKNILKDYEL